MRFLLLGVCGSMGVGKDVAMTPEKEAELFVKLDTLIDMVRRQEDRQVRLEAAVNDLGQRVSRVEGRIEEQSRTLQLALASRMGRKSAAE